MIPAETLQLAGDNKKAISRCQILSNVTMNTFFSHEGACGRRGDRRNANQSGVCGTERPSSEHQLWETIGTPANRKRPPPPPPGPQRILSR